MASMVSPICTIEAHPRGIVSAAFSPDDSRLLIGAGEKGASLWDVATGGCLRTFPGSDTATRTVEFSRDGRYALIPAHDECRIWDLETGSLKQTLKWETGRFSFGIRIGGWFTFAGFHPDGQHVVTVASDREVTVWDLSTGKGKWIRDSEGRSFGGFAALSPAGDFLLIGSQQLIGAAIHCDLSSGRASAVAFHTGGLTSLAVGRSSAISGSYDGTACLWDPRIPRLLRTLVHREPDAAPVAFRQAGKYALAEDPVDGVQIWDMTSGKVIRTVERSDHWNPMSFFPDRQSRLSTECEVSGGQPWPKSSDGAVMSVALSQDGKLAATGTHGGKVHLWDVETGRCLQVFEGFPRDVGVVAISPHAKYLLAAGNGKEYEDKAVIRIWEIPQAVSAAVGASEATPGGLAGHVLAQQVEESIRRRDWNQARDLLRQAEPLPGGDQNPQVVQVLARTDYYTRHASYPYARTLRGHTGKVSSVTVSPDGRKALIASDDGTVRLWDLSASRQEQAIDIGVAPRSATFTADGRLALVVEADRVATIWDLGRRSRVLSAGGADCPANLAALSRNVQTLAVASGNTVVLWDVRSGQRRQVLPHHDEVVSLAFTGNDVLAVARDGTLFRWRTKPGQPDRRFNPGEITSASVFCAAYLDRSRDVALTAAPDGTARMWDFEDGACLGIALGHSGRVISVAGCYPGEGVPAKFVVAACDDGNAYLWNLESGRCERRVPCPGGTVQTVAYSPRMKCMLTCDSLSGDTEVQVWTADRK